MYAHLILITRYNSVSSIGHKRSASSHEEKVIEHAEKTPIAAFATTGQAPLPSIHFFVGLQLNHWNLNEIMSKIEVNIRAQSPVNLSQICEPVC